MELTRRNLFVYGFLAAVWVLVLGWQIEEHARVREAERDNLRNRASDIANTMGAIIRGVRFRGTIRQDAIEAILNEMVNGRTNAGEAQPRELLSVALLNLDNARVAFAGNRPLDPDREDLLTEGEHWGQNSVTIVNPRPVDLGASLIVPPPGELNDRPAEPPRPPPRRETTPGSGSTNAASASTATNTAATNVVSASTATNPPAGMRDNRPGRFRPPFWARNMTEAEFQSMLEKHTAHGLALSLSTEGLEAALTRDLWLRTFIMLLATISAVGSGLALRNIDRSAELKIRLVRASELTSHLREMNVAAAGLAHETRNPLNIIRGLAQMISKQPDTSPAVRQKSRDIVDQADKVAAQLNEFINYSRPREVRRSVLALGAVVNEVVRALSYDLEEKKIRLVVKGEQLQIEADEQMLRQVLFNLILNASQAVAGDGEIQVFAQRQDAREALLEVRDNGPGVSAEQRTEIFKPYFTTQKTGTGLGLAVVQQIVLAHGWEIECLPNQPAGAVFRITHLKLAA